MPILHANLEADLREAARLEQGILTTLVDMASIRRVPGAIDYHGTVNGALSDTGTLRFASLGGADEMTDPAAEDTPVVETALTDTSVNIAVVRRSLVRNIGDLADMTGSGPGDISPERLAADMVFSAEHRFTTVFCVAMATATTNINSTGVNMDHDDFMDALYVLEIANNNGPFFCMLHPRQFADWQEALRAEGGAMQWQQATADMLRIKGQGYCGEINGVGVWKQSRVQLANAGADREGGMWAAGAFGWKNGIPQPRGFGGSSVAVRMDELLVEYTRTANRAITEVAGNAWFGVSVKEQTRLVSITTDA